MKIYSHVIKSFKNYLIYVLTHLHCAYKNCVLNFSDDLAVISNNSVSELHMFGFVILPFHADEINPPDKGKCALTGLPIGYSVIVALTDLPIGHSVIVALTGLPIGHSVIVALTDLPIGYSVIVALTGLPIGYSVIVALTGLPIGYNVTVALTGLPIGYNVIVHRYIYFPQ